MRSYLLCVCVFILIPWELRILHRIALIKIPAYFSYFTHLFSFYYISYILSLQGFPDLDLLGLSSVSLLKPDKSKSCVSTASLELPKDLSLLPFSIWKCIYHNFFMLKIIRLKAIYYGNRHKYLQLIEAISNFRHPHPPHWLGKETSLFQVMLSALLRKKIHQAPSVVTSHYFCCLCFISCLTAHSRNTFKRVAHIGNLKFSGPQTPQMNFLRSDVIHTYDRILSPPWRSSWEGLTVLAPGLWSESLLSNSSALVC